MSSLGVQVEERGNVSLSHQLFGAVQNFGTEEAFVVCDELKFVLFEAFENASHAVRAVVFELRFSGAFDCVRLIVIVVDLLAKMLYFFLFGEQAFLFVFEQMVWRLVSLRVFIDFDVKVGVFVLFIGDEVRFTFD